MIRHGFPWFPSKFALNQTLTWSVQEGVSIKRSRLSTPLLAEFCWINWEHFLISCFIRFKSAAMVLFLLHSPLACTCCSRRTWARGRGPRFTGHVDGLGPCLAVLRPWRSPPRFQATTSYDKLLTGLGSAFTASIWTTRIKHKSNTWWIHLDDSIAPW